MTVLLLLLATFGVQILLLLPGAPAWTGSLLLPTAWLVWLVLDRGRRDPVLLAGALGLAWDIFFEPVIGPGAIAFSAALLLISWVAAHVADRSPLMWAGCGAVATAAIIVVRHVACLPLGLAGHLAMTPFLRSIVLTAAWCLSIGAILSEELKQRWRRMRARRLR